MSLASSVVARPPPLAVLVPAQVLAQVLVQVPVQVLVHLLVLVVVTEVFHLWCRFNACSILCSCAVPIN